MCGTVRYIENPQKKNTQTDQKAELLKLKQTAMCGTVRYIENLHNTCQDLYVEVGYASHTQVGFSISQKMRKRKRKDIKKGKYAMDST